MDIEVPLLQTYVEGLDRALGGGIPRGSTVLVAGTPGTMKTSLILWMMHENARLNGVKSLYVSLEQDMDSLKAGAARMGMRNLHESSVYILDMGQLRRGLQRSESSKDWFTILFEIIKEAVNSRGDGRPAAPSLHQDALDEPRPQRTRPEPRRPEVLRDPRDLEEKVKWRQAWRPPLRGFYRGGIGAGPIGGVVVDAGISPLLIRFQTR